MTKVSYTPEVLVLLRLKLGKLGGVKVGKGVGWKVGHFTDWSLDPKVNVNGDLAKKSYKIKNEIHVKTSSRVCLYECWCIKNDWKLIKIITGTYKK